MFPPNLVQHFKEFNYQPFFFPSDLAGNAPDGFQAHVAQTDEGTKHHKGRAEDAKAQVQLKRDSRGTEPSPHHCCTQINS